MKILIIEDMDKIRKGIVALTKNYVTEDDELIEASDGEEGLSLFCRYQPQLVITDIRMPNMDGLSFIEEAILVIPDVQFIIITGYENFDYAKKALDLGVVGFILKPVERSKFKEAFDKALKNIQHHKLLSVVYAKNDNEKINNRIDDNKISKDPSDEKEISGISFFMVHTKSIKKNIQNEDYESARGGLTHLLSSSYINDIHSVRSMMLLNMMLAQIYEAFSIRDGIMNTNLFQDEHLGTFLTKSEVGAKLLGIFDQFVLTKQGYFTSKNYIADIKKYIDDHFTEDITVDQISQLVHISNSRISTGFKEKYGKAPHKYIVSLRMKFACELLSHTNQPINLIANTVGYEDVTHFYKVFKKEIGKTPINYRQDNT